ncbi:MAG: DUF4347 domain-containing protein, partial [Nitrosomonas sp.]|nr:DUF4347 domain-containing protein [Nitrosomonas sp.]
MPLTDIRTGHATRQSVSDKQLNIKEVIFIDQGIEDYQILIDGARPGVPVHLLDCQSDGVIQLSEVLRQYSRLEAVHIVSHGDIGCLTLGNSLLSTATLSQYQHDLFSWQASFKQGADILIYGCNVGKGISGEYFIQQLAQITGTNIAASSSLTGNSKQGGNWNLDYRNDSVKTEFPFREEIIDTYTHVLVLEDFIGFVNDTHRAPSFTFNSFTYTINDPAWISSDLREMVYSGDPQLELGGTAGTTIFTIAKADGTEFSLTSLTIRDQFNLGDTYTVSGWRDGVKVTGDINHLLTGDFLITNTFLGSSDAGFQNIDTIEISGTDVGFGLEDWTYGAAVTGPAITSAVYDASTNTLVVIGANMLATGGATNDIDVSKLTLTGEGGATYTLTSSNVEIDSATQFTIVLNAVDQINVEGLLNKNGTSSVGAVTYNIAAAANWNPAQAGNADLTGNGITVGNVQTPTITSATYDTNTGVLTVTGTHLVKTSGATNDITANKFTLTGEGGNTYTLTDTANVEITDGTSFSITLSATDKAIINQYINKNGTSSTGGTIYNLAAADDWNTVIGNTDISDAIGNGITVSNVAIPTITSATYDANSGALVVTGTNLLKLNGATNDIVANKFTFTGEGGNTYTLTDTANVEITSGTAFTITLSATDRTAINLIINKNGTTSTGGTTYNLAAAEDWAAGADAAVVVA